PAEPRKTLKCAVATDPLRRPLCAAEEAGELSRHLWQRGHVDAHLAVLDRNHAVAMAPVLIVPVGIVEPAVGAAALLPLKGAAGDRPDTMIRLRSSKTRFQPGLNSGPPST